MIRESPKLSKPRVVQHRMCKTIGQTIKSIQTRYFALIWIGFFYVRLIFGLKNFEIKKIDLISV